MRSALRTCLFYLRKLNLERNLLVQPNFREYEFFHSEKRSLVLSGQVLKNLEILENARFSKEGTLLHLMDHCVSAFGHRMFRKWLCCPLGRAAEINERLNAVEDLMKHLQVLQGSLLEEIKELPDLERKLVHLQRGKINSESFLLVLDGFSRLEKCISGLHSFLSSQSLKSSLLWSLCTIRSTENFGVSRVSRFPDLSGLLSHFNGIIDLDRSSKDTLVLLPGSFPAYDEARKELERIEHRLQVHLNDLKKSLAISQPIKLVNDLSLGEFTIELNKKKLSPSTLNFPNDFQTKNLKGCIRFNSPILRALEKQMTDVKHRMQQIVEDLLVKLGDRFTSHFAEWRAAIDCVAELDCLFSLAITSSQLAGGACKPTFVERSSNCRAFLRAKQMYHPCIFNSTTIPFISNDITMGVDQAAPILLLTGPNMGGKSTLLRSVCIVVVMAQMGCYAPCEFLELSPVDQFFSRIGANDNIMNNQSTFMVELSETESILRNATEDSLVILDELGRGTSTFDGYAIAFATLNYFVENISCRMLFATHYHLLSEEFKRHPYIGHYQMATTLDDERKLVFKYTLEEGICPKSYGMNVALMAGVPAKIVKRAEQISAELEASICAKEMTRKQEETFISKHPLSAVDRSLLLRLIALCSPEENHHYCTKLTESIHYPMIFELWKTLKNGETKAALE